MVLATTEAEELRATKGPSIAILLNGPISNSPKGKIVMQHHAEPGHKRFTDQVS